MERWQLKMLSAGYIADDQVPQQIESCLDAVDDPAEKSSAHEMRLEGGFLHRSGSNAAPCLENQGPGQQTS